MSNPSRDLPPNLPRAAFQRRRRGIAWIWIVPLVAVLVGLGLVIQAILAQGPEITLQFAVAEGLEANKTKVRYKDVDIGVVKSVSLSEDRKAVRVRVQMDKQAEGLLVNDSRFWVVRPRVAAGGVSGLSTVLSGAYIAVDPGQSAETQRDFVGLEVPPLVTSDTPGRAFLLKGADLGSLDFGAPVYYRRLQVGRVISYDMAPDGGGVEVRVFIHAPYDALVSSDARFWHASGIDVSLNAEGVHLDTQSLLSLAVGGIAFLNPERERGVDAPAAADSEFVLHANQSAALKNPETRIQKYVLVFRESVRGLSVGSEVDFRGLIAGEVTRIDLNFDPARTDFTMRVELNLYPERFAKRSSPGVRPAFSEEMARRVLDTMVARGFRAQMRTGNMLTGQRYIALDFFPNAKPARVNWQGRVPELPVQPGVLDSLQDQLLSIVETLRTTLQHVDQLVTRVDQEMAPELTSTLKAARQTLDSADRVLQTADHALAADGPSQTALRETLREVGQAATAVRDLAELLERQPEALLTGKKGATP